MSLHVCRIGMFGYPTSGKTAILASLAMNRMAHPDGINLSWSRETLGSVADDKSEMQREEFKGGVSWVNMAVSQIQKGLVPQANRIIDRQRLLFSLTHPKSKKHCLIELLDYSGELVTATSDGKVEKVRESIKEYFKSLDGILILAEMPGKTAKSIAVRNTENITNVFADLVKEREAGKLDTCPIGILVNKWDRHGKIDYTNPAAELKKLDKLLKSPPLNSHLNLWNVVQAVTPPYEKDGAIRGAGFIRPVSAFGKCKVVKRVSRGDDRVVEIYETPISNQVLMSFGLEDAFLEIVNLKDKIDLANFEATTKSASIWRFWDFMAKSTIKPAPSEVLNRFPNNPKAKILAKRAKSTSIRIGLTQTAIFLLFIVFSQQSIMTWIDYPKVQSFQALLQKEDWNRSPDEINQIENWLSRYALNNEPHWRYLSYNTLLSRDDAIHAYHNFKQEREERLWNIVLSTEPNSTDERSKLRNYLSAMPNGKHLIVANQKLTRNLLASQISDVAKKIEYEIAAIAMLSSPADKKDSFWEEAHKRIQNIEIPPNPEELDQQNPIFDDQIEKLDQLRASKQEQIIIINAQALSSSCSQKVELLDIFLGAGDLAGATDQFERMDRNCGELIITTSQFMERINRSFKQIVNSRIKDGNLGDLASKMNAANQSTILLELDEKFGGGLMDRINEVGNYTELVSEAKLYKYIQKRWNGWDTLTDDATPTILIEKFAKYQQVFPNGKMKKEMLAADNDFHRITSKPHYIEVQPEFFSACFWSKRPYDFSFTFNGTPIASLGPLTAGCRTLSWPTQTRVTVLVDNLTKPQNLSVSLKRKLNLNSNWDKLFFSEQHAALEERVPLHRLRESATFSLRNIGFDEQPKVTLRLASWPRVSSTLPLWSIPIDEPEWLKIE